MLIIVIQWFLEYIHIYISYIKKIMLIIVIQWFLEGAGLLSSEGFVHYRKDVLENSR